jgi:Flp pilus assembly protein TadG
MLTGWLRRFRRDRRSTAALEFAFIAPILVALLLGTYEIANAALIYEEVQNAAHAIPASVSDLAVQGDGSTTLTYAQIQLAASEIWEDMPELRRGFQDGTKSITISSVTFIPTLPPSSTTATAANQATCTPSKSSNVTCTYTPTVIWSVAYVGGDSGRSFSQSVIRSCTGKPSLGSQSNATVLNTTSTASQTPFAAVVGGLNDEAPQSSGIKATTVPTWRDSDLTSLPTYQVADPDPNMAPPSPILVVDIHLQYQPIFGIVIKNGIDFYATGFWPVRSVKTDTSTNGVTSPLTLTEQFTTISTDTAADATAGVVAGAPSGTYCVNTSPYLYPAAAIVTGTS